MVLLFHEYGLQLMKSKDSKSQKSPKIICRKKKRKKKRTYRNIGILKSMFWYMHSVLGLASFCMNYSINRSVDQPVDLLRCYQSPGCFDCGLQLVCIVVSHVVHLPLDINPYIFYGVQIRRVCWPMKNSNPIVIKPGIGT